MYIISAVQSFLLCEMQFPVHNFNLPLLAWNFLHIVNIKSELTFFRDVIPQIKIYIFPFNHWAVYLDYFVMIQLVRW